MASSMMMDRTVSAQTGFGTSMNASATAPACPTPANALLIPRCKMTFEKCEGGMKIHCVCDDEVACATLQNLCRMCCDGLCSCCCMLNGMCLCQCNLAMAICKCECTKDGVCVTCCSGDAACCEIIQACCDCLCGCTAAGCSCCLCFNNTPVCCC